MTVFPVLLFAGLREAARAESLEVSLPERATVRDLVDRLAQEHPALAGILSQCRVAVDEEFVGEDHPLKGAREIAVIPPVSGGSGGGDSSQRYAVLDTALSLASVVAHVEHAGAGGLVTFTGNVRLRSRGQTIERLEYEAYVPMARKVMAEIGARIEADIAGARVAIHHRIGTLSVGETAVVIAASAPHRAEAFDACRRAIEALKQDVPIWKREVSTDGAEWIGQGP